LKAVLTLGALLGLGWVTLYHCDHCLFVEQVHSLDQVVLLVDQKV